MLPTPITRRRMLLAAMLPVVVVCVLAGLLSAAAGRMSRTTERIDRDRRIEMHLDHIIMHLSLRQHDEVLEDFQALRVMIPRTTPNDPLLLVEPHIAVPASLKTPAELQAALNQVHSAAHEIRAAGEAYIRGARVTDRTVLFVMWLGALISIGASIMTAMWLTGHADWLALAQAHLTRKTAELRETADQFAHQKRATLKARQHAREVLTNMTEALLTVNSDWCIIEVTDDAAKLLELPTSLLLGSNLWAALSHLEGSFEQEIRRSNAGHIPLYFEEYYEPLDRWLEFRTLPLDDSLSIFIKDNSEMHRERALKQELLQRIAQAAAEWQHLFDGMDVPILVVEPNGTLIRMNEVARKLAEKDYARLIGADVRSSGDSQLWSVAATLAEMVCDSRRHAEVRTHDSATGKTWEVRATPFVQPDGQVRAIVKARDVTEIIELEESLRLADKLSTIGLVTAGVAHEVRNPLFSISSLVDALDSTFPNRDELRPFMERLRSQVDRMRVLMTDLLEYGRASSQTVKGSVAAVVESSISMCRFGSRNDIDIVLISDDDSEVISMDAPRLELVFRNLVENALQHAPAGSRVEVTVTRTRTHDREWVECIVADRGPGFKEADLARVFEPFFTRRKGGTGLGLSIVQRIVLEHMGTVRAQNRAGGGAEVVVRLPVQEQGAAVATAEEVYVAV